VTRRDAFGMGRAAFAATALFIAGGVVPVVGAMAMLFAPAPVMVYAVGLPNPMWRMAGVLVIAAGLIALVAGPFGAGVYVLTFGLATVIMCGMLERRKPFELIVLCTAATLIVVGAVAALVSAGSPEALASSLRHELMAGMLRGEKFYKALGMEAGLSGDTPSIIVDTTLRLSPALAATLAAFSVLANLAVFWRVTGKQQRVGYMLFGDLVRWSTPEWLIWALIVAGFGLFIPLAPLGTIALDCLVCVAAVYFCQGLAIMAFYFRVLAMPPLARGLIYFVTAVQPVLAVLVCAAGIFDLWIDFRRLKPPSQEAGNFGDFL
jgi:uncharacterized protein YybS (DUF2232 family)